MKIALVRWCMVALAASVLAACNGQNYQNVYGGPTPGPPCVLPSNFTMMYPINNSSVPPSTTMVYIATTQTTIAGNYNVIVQPPNGLPAYHSQAFGQVNLSQVPKPHAQPAAGALIYAAQIGGLVSGSTYQIGFNNLGTNCTASLIDTFTTR